MLSHFRLVPKSIVNIASRGLKAVQALSHTGKSLGATLEEVQATNGEEVRNTVAGILQTTEIADPSVKAYNVRGDHFHRSSKDPTETEDVLSVQLFNDTVATKQSYLETLHIHRDGTFKTNKKTEGS
ncbi:hypothetical protein GALMADRAFT_133704 [Galerina marginata CBS 339.88]|uniref:Uncharacterized protein n=1 Tax=Galerina marginata (strain CBS 339.88) TaxID=685588 RepID=A0A067TMK5_GALM3|nr:hypothetical protein GALMADRAFT_133704 [Galerina marginata CBS 339.88]